MSTAQERYRSGQMRIVAASVRTKDGTTWTLAPPARHCHIQRTLTKESLINAEQGFQTNCGRFLTRKQALAVVRRNGQLKGELLGSVLTSEDLW